MYLTHFIPTKWPRGRTNANIGLDHPHTHSEPHFLLSPPKVYLLNSIVNELPYKLVVKPNNSCGCRYAVSQDPLTASLNKNWINKWNKCVTSLTPSRSPSMRLQGKPSDFIYRQTFEAELKGAGGSPLATNFKRLANAHVPNASVTSRESGSIPKLPTGGWRYEITFQNRTCLLSITWLPGYIL